MIVLLRDCSMAVSADGVPTWQVLDPDPRYDGNGEDFSQPFTAEAETVGLALSAEDEVLLPPDMLAERRALARAIRYEQPSPRHKLGSWNTRGEWVKGSHETGDFR